MAMPFMMMMMMIMTKVPAFYSSSQLEVGVGQCGDSGYSKKETQVAQSNHTKSWLMAEQQQPGSGTCMRADEVGSGDSTCHAACVEALNQTKV